MRKDILSIREIVFDEETKSFRFTYNPKDFANNRSLPKEWIVYSCVDRIVNFRSSKDGRWHPEEVNVTENLRKIFEDNQINININIIPQIEDNQNLNNEFYEKLIYSFNNILQLRNSDSEKGIDYIHSPVKPFFDSRIYEKEGQNEDFTEKAKKPVSGDANGAYNIARKGLIMLRKIIYNPEKLDLYINNEKWDDIAQNWNDFINKF